MLGELSGWARQIAPRTQGTASPTKSISDFRSAQTTAFASGSATFATSKARVLRRGRDGRRQRNGNGKASNQNAEEHQHFLHNFCFLRDKAYQTFSSQDIPASAYRALLALVTLGHVLG